MSPSSRGQRCGARPCPAWGGRSERERRRRWQGGASRGEPPALPCAALPCTAALPGLPRRRRFQGRARMRARREKPAARDRGEGKERRRGAAGRSCRGGRGGGTAAGRNHTRTPPPPNPVDRLPLIARRSPVRPDRFPAVTWLLPPPPRGFGSRFTFTLAPPRGSRGPWRLTGALAARGSSAAPLLPRL